MTGLISAGISMYLDSNPPIAAATRTTYSNFRNGLANAIEGVYVREGTTWATNRLYFGLTGLLAAGRNPANNTTAAAMVTRLLSLKPAGVTGWGDTEWGWAAKPSATG